jgi:predicted PurR-regulated permease PerM
MFLIATCDAVLLGIGFWLIGMPLILPLMLLLFLGALVPFVGPILAAVVAALVAFAEGSPSMAALSVGVALIVQQIEGNLLQPLIMGRAVELHPSVVLFAVTAGGVLGGVVGIFLAVPIAAALATTLSFVRENHHSEETEFNAPRSSGALVGAARS